MRDKKAVQKFTTSYVDLTNLGNEQLFSLSTLYTFQIFCLQMLKFGGNLITVWVLQKKEKKKTVPPAFSQDCLYSSQELDSLVSERSFRGHFLSENVTKNYFMSLVQIAHDHVLRNHHHHDHFCRILRLGYTMHTKCWSNHHRFEFLSLCCGFSVCLSLTSLWCYKNTSSPHPFLVKSCKIEFCFA